MNDDWTIDFYNRNAAQYAATTIGVDLGAVRERFAALLPASAKILDAGCGAGRDSLAFLGNGFEVVAAEPSAELASIAARLTGLDVIEQRFQEFEFDGEFEGVWACASLLHVPATEMPDVLKRLGRALKPRGVLFASFKIGDDDFIDDGRRFTVATPARWREWIESVGVFAVVDEWISEDFLGRDDVKWLNCLAERV